MTLKATCPRAALWSVTRVDRHASLHHMGTPSPSTGSGTGRWSGGAELVRPGLGDTVHLGGESSVPGGLALTRTTKAWTLPAQQAGRPPPPPPLQARLPQQQRLSVWKTSSACRPQESPVLPTSWSQALGAQSSFGAGSACHCTVPLVLSGFPHCGGSSGMFLWNASQASPNLLRRPGQPELRAHAQQRPWLRGILTTMESSSVQGDMGTNVSPETTPAEPLLPRTSP